MSTPVSSVQRKLSAGTFHFVIRPIGGAPKESEGGALRLVRRGELQGVQIAARPPLDSLSDNVIPLGLARELGDLFVTKGAQARKLNGAPPALPRPAPCSSWDEKVEPVESPVTPMLLVDLPDDLLVQILASPTKKLARGFRVLDGYLIHEAKEGQALAEAGACCHAFATCVRAAAKLIADRHGWRLLPVAGGTPMQHLSRLEHDTSLVRSILHQMNKLARPLPAVSLWVEEVSLGFIGALSIDAQARLQHTLELGRLLILLAMRVGPDDPQRDDKISGFIGQLCALMMQPGTPLDASWLAACVFPLVKMLIAIVTRRDPKTRIGLVVLLCFLEPAVLRSQPDTFHWLRFILCTSAVARPGDQVTVESAFTVGQRAWNERCEAQGLVEGCDTETRDAKLEAILDSGVRGCFIELELCKLGLPAVSWRHLSVDGPRFAVGGSVFPAVYH